MIKWLKNSIALLLVFTLVAPTIVKLEHHHEQFVCHAKGEKHLHTEHEKCAACDFEFSVFVPDSFAFYSVKLQPEVYYSNLYSSIALSTHSQYSFSLRAPPLVTNI